MAQEKQHQHQRHQILHSLTEWIKNLHFGILITWRQYRNLKHKYTCKQHQKLIYRLRHWDSLEIRKYVNGIMETKLYTHTLHSNNLSLSNWKVFFLWNIENVVQCTSFRKKQRVTLYTQVDRIINTWKQKTLMKGCRDPLKF